MVPEDTRLNGFPKHSFKYQTWAWWKKESETTDKTREPGVHPNTARALSPRLLMLNYRRGCAIVALIRKHQRAWRRRDAGDNGALVCKEWRGSRS